MSNNLHLKDIIINEIENSAAKKITFADYMNLVLYHPCYGYYSSGKVKIGSSGDFFTSPSLGKDFGELLAEQFREMWEILGCPCDFVLVEVGAGLGLLADDILGYLEQKYPAFIKALDYRIIETSQSLILQQQNYLKKYLDKGIKICWKQWKDIPEESLMGCIFSNELVDAFPVHQIVLQRGELKEIYVTYKGDCLQEVIDEVSTEEIKDYFALVGVDFPSDSYPEGYRTEVNLLVLSWLKTVAEKLKRGYVLTIDYGYPARKYYHPQRYRGTLKCYYQHRHHSDPYVNIGEQDITAHVDFTALEFQGQRCGLQKLGFTPQAMFLMSLGLGERFSELSSGKYHVMEVMKRRDALHQLISPTGLGGFGVLIQGKGLTTEEMAHPLKGIFSL